MKILIIVIAIIIIYLISFYFVYWHLKKTYSKYGIFENSNVDFLDIFVNICPVLNTLAFLILLFDNPYDNKHRDMYYFEKIIKKINNIYKK